MDLQHSSLDVYHAWNMHASLKTLPVVGCANLTAWCSGPRGCALTRDVLLLDVMRLCAGMPARSTVHRDGDEVWVEDG
ncbi:unnamed protein product [Prunus armeniaca]